MEWMWDIHLCVYSCLAPSSFIMNGLGVRFYFLDLKRLREEKRSL